MADRQDDALLLAQAVARRICHDLAGPLGTLGNALECLDDPDAMPLAVETEAALTARLRLLRGAWAGGVEALDAHALAALIPGLAGADRLHLNCAALAAPLDGTAARLVLCLLLVASGSLPKGGTIHIGASGEQIWLELEAPNAAWPAALQHPTADDLAPRTLPATLCRRLAQTAGWQLTVAGTHVRGVAG